MDGGDSPGEIAPLYLVTGGCGFIGRKLAEALKRGSQRVRVLDRKECRPQDRIEGVEYMVGDICDLRSRACYWASEKVNTVFHCARLADPTADYNAHYDVNVRGTENVLDAAIQQGVSSVIYTSSVSVVVDGRDINGGDESMEYPEKHLDHASATKALAEQLVLRATGQQTVQGTTLYTCCLRPEMVFGPGDNHFVPQLLDKAREGEITHMIGDGANLVDFTYVDNVILAHLLAAEAMVESSSAPGQVFFVTNGEARPFWDFLTAIFDGMGYPPPTKAIGQRLAYGTAYVLEKAGGLLKYFMSFRPKLTRQLVFNMSMNHYFSHAKATKELGYTPVVTLDTGIERTMEWIRTRHYSTDVAVFDRWAKARDAISPDKARVVVPLTSRHSSSSSINDTGEGLLLGADGAMLGFGASPPRPRYSDGDAANTTLHMGAVGPSLHLGAAGWHGAADKGIPISGATATIASTAAAAAEQNGKNLSGRGSPQHGNGSFCASIPEDNEVEDFDALFASSTCQDLRLSDDDEAEPSAPKEGPQHSEGAVGNSMGSLRSPTSNGTVIQTQGGSGIGSGSGSPRSSKPGGQGADAGVIASEGVWHAATQVVG